MPRTEGTERVRVPFFRVALDEAEIAAVDRVLRSGWLTTGEECANFEREFAETIGGGVEAVAVNSNTAGMHLALEALGIKQGDEVIVPVVTFTATAEVVRYLGADPVFVDVDPETICVTADAIRKKITSRTRAIMPVHFAGLPCDMTAISRVAEEFGLPVVEDAAHAFPCSHANVPIGAHGSAAAVFSFYANKTITTGEGGMVVSKDAEFIKRVRIMRLHGIDRDVFRRHTDKPGLWRYDVVAPGFKYNLTDTAAALGRQQLLRADRLRDARKAISQCYDRAFAKLPLTLPAHASQGDTSSYHLYIVQVGASSPINRDDLMAVLEAKGIGYSVHYTPLHQLSYWRERYGLSDADFPFATEYAKRCVSLPLYPSMGVAEIESVIDAVTGAFG